MTGIVLSASVRQNLLSLQSTAALLATTQNDLATGNKVNSALDNPTNFFTAQGLTNRSSDINNLLDAIGNGVQVLQAANTGITSLQKLVDSAKSVATQALQTTIGYSSKSSFSVSLGAGATAANLLGGTSFTSSTFTGVVANNGAATPAPISAATSLTSGGADSIVSTINNNDTLTVDGHTITFKTGAPPTAATVVAGSGVATGNTNVVTDGNGDSTVFLNSGAANVGDLLTAVDIATGVKTASISGGTATLTTSGATGVSAASVPGGQITISTGITSDLSISSNNNTLLAALGIGNGLATTSLARGVSANSNLSGGTTLDIADVGTGAATNITFGAAAGQIHDLNGLNAALAANNLQATVDANGNLTIQTNNDNASQQIGALTGSTGLFAGKTASAPIADPNAQATRAGLVSQYNNILSQITTTSQDSSFNGVNLLNGDSLKLVFNETGSSTLNITGTTFSAVGLGLSNLLVGTDFIDNNATNKVLTSLSNASSALRAEASTLGSNLSVVQIRQDFNKNLINVLQTGASNLTLADPNEEAANSQALSTRQSIAVSALALANQSQQSVLQLLR
jgi:flagellin-like hook-associated protein FlgL